MAETAEVPPAPAAGGRARAAIEAALAKAESLGVPFAVVVVDAGGAPVAMQRMAGAAPAAIEAGLARAATAMLFARPTSGMVPPGPGRPTAGAGADGGAAAFAPGGVPITDENGRSVGAVGACGGRPDQDHEVAMAAAAAF